MTQAVQPPDTEATDAAEGEMQSTLLRVSGIFRTGIQAIDAHIIQLPLPEAQALLGVPDRVTQVAVLLEREGDSLMVARGLRKQLTGVPVEILPWRESMPTVAAVLPVGRGLQLCHERCGTRDGRVGNTQHDSHASTRAPL